MAAEETPQADEPQPPGPPPVDDANPDDAPVQPDAGDEGAEHHSPLDFPVVGIGASAGGLEAFEALLRELPSDPGAASWKPPRRNCNRPTRNCPR